MNSKTLKRNLIISIIFFAVLSGNLLRTKALDTIRPVDALQLLVVGVMLGVILVNAVMFMKFKEK